MFSYMIAVLAGILIASVPSSLFETSPPSGSVTMATGAARRQRPSSPRPRLNYSLLAVDTPHDEPIICPPDTYGARVLSTEPLVIYLEGFLSVKERMHLMEISDPLFVPSTFTNDGSTTTQNTTIRDSHVALIPRTPTVRCIEQRALALQSWRRDIFIERLRTQKYGRGGHYTHHYDWSRNAGGWGRVSSMMVWVDDGSLTERLSRLKNPQDLGRKDAGDTRAQNEKTSRDVEEEEEKNKQVELNEVLRDDTGTGIVKDDLKGGGTEFPRLEIRGRDSEADSRGLCEIIECEALPLNHEGGEGGGETVDGASGKEHGGTTFKVKPGSAVYWENFRGSDGMGYEETWHAGLPVEEGTKVGLNIWTVGRIE